jgi:hypothetical protein
MEREAVNRVRERLKEGEVFVSMTGGNIKYLSCRGLRDPVASAVLIDKDREMAFVSSLEMNRASELLGMDLRVFSPYPRVKKDGTRLKSLIKKECHGKGIVSDARIEGLRTRVEDLVSPLRMIKDNGELRLIKEANRMTKEVDLDSIVVEGRSELRIARDVEQEMLRNGAGGFAFDTIVACDEHTSYSHHEPGETPFRNAAMIDYGARHKGYCADITRTIIRGNERLERIGSEIEMAIEAVVEKFSEGSRCADIDREMRKALGALSEHFYHSTGHGIGVEVHEAPSISITSKNVLEKNMVFTIEPGVYIRGLGGVRIEDDFYVSDRIRKI